MVQKFRVVRIAQDLAQALPFLAQGLLQGADTDGCVADARRGGVAGWLYVGIDPPQRKGHDQ